MLINQLWKPIRMLIILMGALNALITVSYIYVLGQIIEVSVNHSYTQLIIFCCSGLALFCAQELIALIYEWQMARLLPHYQHQTRGLLLTKWFLIVPKRQSKSGMLYNGLVNDLTQVVKVEVELTYELARGATMLSATLNILFYLHWIVGLTTLSVIATTVLIMSLTGKMSAKWQRKLSLTRGKYYGNSKQLNFNKDQFIHMRLLGKYLELMRGEFNTNREQEISAKLRINAFNDVAMLIVELSLIAPVIAAAILYGEQNITYGAIATILFFNERAVTSSVSALSSISEFVSFKAIKAKYVPQVGSEVKTLTFENVQPVFDKPNFAQEGFNLKIKPSGKYLWKGPNGVGKSTLLELFDKNTNFTGQLIVNDQVVNGETISAYNLVRPLKNSAMFTSETALQKVVDVSANEVYLAVSKLIASYVDLSIERTAPSQGEMQLLSLLHALANKPEILILDESITSVSQNLRISLYDFLLSQDNLTLILVDHTLDKSWERRFDEVIIFYA